MDRRTLFTVQAALLIFLGGVVLVGYLTQSQKRRDRGAVWFAAGFLLGGIGLALQAYRGILPPLFSIIAGNGLFMLFPPLCNRAVARTTWQQRDYLLPMLLLNAATLANFAYYTWPQPNVLMRTLEAVGVTSVMYLACIHTLWRSRDRVILPAVRAMMTAYGLHLTFSVMRAVIAWKLQTADAWFSWSGIVTIAALALSYLWVGSLRAHEELERTAMTDPLTGLFNRRALDVLAIREIEYARRRDIPCSAVMMDVDRFKQVNDSLGHAAGDASLCAVAHTLQTTLRVTDIATRLGGDEFFILLPDCDEAQACLIEARLKTAIGMLQLQTMGNEVFTVSASMGKVTLRGNDLTLEELLHASDIMLYREKQAQRTKENALTAAPRSRQSGAHTLQRHLTT